ncbi:MAG: ABC transporter permease [Planctomycetes bacterium]|nr:ABC transporter permease [Planctomycetota bacterium]
MKVGWLRAAGPLLGLVCVWLLFAATAGTKFMSWPNQELMLLQTAVVGTAAVGATWIIVSGGIDLSVGSNIALCTMAGAGVLQAGGGLWLALVATIATGTLVGWLIGALVVGALPRVLVTLGCGGGVFLVAHGLGAWAWPLGVLAGAVAWLSSRRLSWKLPLSPFIVTLGLWGTLRGLAKGLGDNQPIYFERNDTLAGLMVTGGVLPAGVWILLAVAAIAAVLLRRSVFGRRVVAIGSSRQTARLCGVDVPRTEMGVYLLGCTCAGIAAVLQLSYLSMGDSTTAQGYELKTIAAAVIGGASLAGGEGSIGGTLLGALIMTVVDNGCTKLGLDNWVQEVVTGGIIVGAVALDRLRLARR